MKRKFIGLLLALGISFSGNMVYCLESGNTSISRSSGTNIEESSNLSTTIPSKEYICVLSSTKNTRDLGGYRTIDGKTTKYNRIFRSDNALSLSDEEIEKLAKLNLVLDIDLRTPREISKCEDAFSKIPGVSYLSVPVHYVNEHDTIKRLQNNEMKLEQAFIDAASDESIKQKIKQVFDSIANVSNGLILIHCSWGKDRTGIISSLILGLCGVNRNDIIDNFAVTQELLNPGVKDFSSLSNLCSTDKSIMDNFIKFIEASGGYEKFLKSCGIEESTLSKIKSRLLDEPKHDGSSNLTSNP